MNQSAPGTFGSTLRALRRLAGLSQRELAERAGLDFSYISKLENDRLPPPAADTIVSLCREINGEPELLLALTGKIRPEVHQAVSTSPSAQRFLLAAQRMGLTSDEWERMSSTLHRLRET